MLGKIEGKRKKGWQDEMGGCYHWLNGYEFEDRETRDVLQFVGLQSVRHNLAISQQHINVKTLFNSDCSSIWEVKSMHFSLYALS